MPTQKHYFKISQKHATDPQIFTQTKCVPPNDLHDHTLNSLTMITWNTWHIRSSLLGTLEMFQPLPKIIHIQETKLKKHISTKYTSTKYPEYEIIYNNINDINTCSRRPFTPYIPNGGRLLTTLPLYSINSYKNIHKVSTTLQLSLYLQVIQN